MQTTRQYYQSTQDNLKEHKQKYDLLSTFRKLANICKLEKCSFIFMDIVKVAFYIIPETLSLTSADLSVFGLNLVSANHILENLTRSI